VRRHASSQMGFHAKESGEGGDPHRKVLGHQGLCTRALDSGRFSSFFGEGKRELQVVVDGPKRSNECGGAQRRSLQCWFGVRRPTVALRRRWSRARVRGGEARNGGHRSCYIYRRVGSWRAPQGLGAGIISN
jgi:hypothetical protein